MNKGTIVLCKIHKSLEVKFSLVLEDDPVSIVQQRAHGWNVEQTCRKFTYNNNKFFRVNPKPYVTFDISNKTDKKEGWNTNSQVNLNQRALFLFKRALRELIEEFRTVKNLFYLYDTGEMVVNQKLAEAHRKIIPTSSKTIILQACVIQNEENQEELYEGCFLAINRLDSFTYLTFEEMEFLYSVVSEIRMTELALHLLELEKLHTKEEGDLKIPHKVEPEVVEETPPDIDFHAKQKEKQIPDI